MVFRQLVKIAVVVAKLAIVVFAIGAPIMAISEHITPWRHSVDVRAKFVDTHLYVAVGSASGLGEEQTEQTALLIPKTFVAPKLVSVTIREGKTALQISYLYFWLFLTAFIYGWYLVIGFIRRRIGSFRED